MDKFECGGYFFSSNFDSGNLGRVELVNLCEGKLNTDNYISAEFNLWTKPDCGGTQYENSNRTWFYFGIRGGQPFKNVKFNIMNLNKQAKLYSQGMHPVFKIGLKGKWSRIKDKPTYNIKEDNFTVSFIHKNLDTVNLTFYYAFTFPYTYTELQSFLDKLDEKYVMRTIELKINLCRKVEFEKNKKKTQEAVESIATINKNLETFQTLLTDASKIALEESAKELGIKNDEPDIKAEPNNNNNNDLDCYSTNDICDDIYYFRELLITSVEGRRIDLVTLTSFHGVQDIREARVHHLFPDKTQPRCHTFKDKKIIFLSSRVHPGETPASFVLNGFLNLLLDRKSIIGATLRKMYVFKIVPFLNPDGVYNGLYRSDTLGHNLNRVYLNPSYVTQPTIYAARKIIRFYHYGYDKMDDPQSFEVIHEISKSFDISPLSQQASTIGFNSDNGNVMATNNYNNNNNNSENLISFNDFLNTNIMSSDVVNNLKEAAKSKENDNENVTTIIDYQKFLNDKNEKDIFDENKNSKQMEKDDPNVDSNKNQLYSEAEFFDIIDCPSGNDISSNSTPFITPSCSEDLKDVSKKELLNDTTTEKNGDPFINTSSENSTLTEDTSRQTNKLLLNFGGKIWCQYCVNNLLYKSLETRIPGITKILAQTIDTVDTQIIENSNKRCCNCGIKENELNEKCTGQSSSADEELEASMSKSSLSSSGDDNKESSPPLDNQSPSKTIEKIDGKIFTEKLVQEIKPVLTTGPALRKTPNSLVKARVNSGNFIKKTILESHEKKFPLKSNSGKIEETKLKETNPVRQNLIKKSTVKRDKLVTKTRSSPPPIYGSFKNTRKNHNKNISSEFSQVLSESEDLFDTKFLSDENSNMFLYIDMHGHASKKGVFMYGNHLPSLSEAVECMLLPRLMSMNCHHFHFDACNFSERNMYYKGKKDGLSKEGSGRVAVYKAIGLIKSYTLESNYNTGKCVNILPPRCKEPPTKMVNLVPPKYTPTIFEEVGRALGPSILDLTNSNPLSRVNNSEFRTLQGLRNSLHQEIDRNFSRTSINGKTTKTKGRRLKVHSVSSGAPLEVHKENKNFHNVPWEIKPSSSSNVVASSITPRTVKSVAGKVGGVLPASGKPQKKIITKNSQPRTFGKKDSSGKKTKVLCDASSAITKFQENTVKVIGKDQTFQVPRKRIKVSAPGNSKTSIDSSLSHDSYGGCYADTPSPNVANIFSINDERTYLKDIYGKSLCLSSCGSSSLPNFYTAPNTDGHFVDSSLPSSAKTLKSNSVLDINDISGENKNLPCCSSTLKRNVVMPIIPKTTKANSFISNMTGNNQNLIIQQQSGSIKKTKFSKSASKQPTKMLKSNTSGELTKLKKKRIVKSDLTIKRKIKRIELKRHGIN